MKLQRAYLWKVLMAQIEQIYNFLISCRIFSKEQKGRRKGNRVDTVYWSTHRQGEQNETQKYSYGVDWLQKGIYDMVLQSEIINCLKMYETSDEVNRENYEKLDSGTDGRRKKLSWGEHSERYLPGRCAITITICDSDDATQLHTKKMPWGWGDTNLLNRKINYQMYCLQKMKKNWRL